MNMKFVHLSTRLFKPIVLFTCNNSELLGNLPQIRFSVLLRKVFKEEHLKLVVTIHLSWIPLSMECQRVNSKVINL